LAFDKLHLAMLDPCVYLPPNSYEARFTSLAHSDAFHSVLASLI
jgi:glutamate-1-semialdehyde aminotransferase